VLAVIWAREAAQAGAKRGGRPDPVDRPGGSNANPAIGGE